ncbi:MAG: DUF1080 domain-containing protein [Candidatus Latescibacterota bacterium]|nr:DUF1080 domain-containing protein [Candidatus Latescibacterota bacterium]
MAQLGYDDTNFIPGQPWRVHDSQRPQPTLVTPSTEPGAPPSDAVVLFDGSDLTEWESARDLGRDAEWKVENDYMEVVAKTGDIQTRKMFADCQLHLEWAAPEKVEGDSQGRGNSGVFLMGRYEVQVLDCYDNPTYADGATGAIYGQYPPLVNACRKPGEWQTYDIIFEAPIWEEGWLVTPAFVTVIFNGVLLHHRQEAMGPTGHRNVCSYAEPDPEVGPLKLQDHGNPIRFRNIWMRPLVGYDGA